MCKRDKYKLNEHSGVVLRVEWFGATIYPPHAKNILLGHVLTLHVPARAQAWQKKSGACSSGQARRWFYGIAVLRGSILSHTARTRVRVATNETFSNFSR